MSNQPRFNPKRVSVAINDIYKAYDHVDTSSLKSLLSDNKQDTLCQMVEDYDKCDLHIGQTIIKRTRGLPQGAKGAPALFNFYLNHSLNTKLSSDFIYADNILLMEKNTQKLRQKEKWIERECNKIGFKFEKPWDHWSYAKTNIPNDISYPNLDNLKHSVSNIEKAEHKTTRVLGYQLKIKQDTLQQNFKVANKGILYKLPRLPPYKAISYYKQRIKPKYMFHYRNKPLPKRIIQTIIRKMTCIRNLPRIYMDINHVYDKGISNYWSKYWSLYTYYKRGNISIPDGSRNMDQFRRFKILCSIIDKYYLSIYQITKFIIHGNAWIMPSETNYQQLKNNLKMLDLAWFCITRKFSESKMRLVMELTLLNRSKKKTKYEKPLPNLNLNLNPDEVT